jgi:hypothetical protein
MPKRCSGAFSAGTVQQIKQRYEENSGGIPMGTCALCGRQNVVARNKSGQWVADSHDAPHSYRSGKRTGDKRMSK